MEVFNELNKKENLALALGFFDGVHLGHKKVITTLVKQAQIKGLESAVITFDKNPADYFSDEPTLQIQSYKDKELIMESLGVDYLYELDFEQFKDITAQDYIKDVLVKYFNPTYIIVGSNHTFGKDKEGTPSLLEDFSSKYGYECCVIPQQKYNDSVEISSTAIRKSISEGNLFSIKTLLGRNFSVRNSVIKGGGMAKSMGYPTANIVWPSSMVKLPYGVYMGYAQVGKKICPALISWGVKPTLTDGRNETLECHIYNFSENLYGKIINVIFERKLRDQEKFASPLLLKTQIRKDYLSFEKWAKQRNTF